MNPLHLKGKSNISSSNNQNQVHKSLLGIVRKTKQMQIPLNLKTNESCRNEIWKKKWQNLPHFHLHISNIPNMYMYKKLHHIKGRDVELGVFRLPHSDLLEEQSYRGDTHGGPAIDFLHIDKLLAKRKWQVSFVCLTWFHRTVRTWDWKWVLQNPMRRILRILDTAGLQK